MPRKPAAIGSEYLNPNGIRYIKVSESKVWREAWIPKGRYIIQKQLGRQLEKHEKVIKLDGCKGNFDLRNLIIINKKDNSKIIFDSNLRPVRQLTHNWSILFKQCKRCNSDKKPHAAKGYCTSCYGRS